MVENGNTLGKGLLRVRLLALEARVRGRVPCACPVFSWLTEHAGDVLTKYLVCKDGATLDERLFGKPVRAEGLNFGECVWWRPPHDKQLYRPHGAAMAGWGVARPSVGFAGASFL